MAASNVIQLVGRDEGNSFNDQAMMSLITSCDAPKDHYPVVSIIGPQSTGKSTLMNGIFETDFAVMDQSIGRGRTTMGIWASICHNPRAVVLDVEGTDGVARKDDLGFETRSALFALEVSEVTFFNFWIYEVERNNSTPLLTNVFQEIMKQPGQGREKHLVCAVRNYNEKKTKKEVLVDKVTLSINEIWDSIHQEKKLKLERYFTLHVELFPDLEYKTPEFNEKCKEIKGRIASRDWGDRTLSHVPVCEFALFAKEIWGRIMKNETLDIPSYTAARSRASCENIMKKKFDEFVESKYPKLTKPVKDNPKEFDNHLQQILEDIISVYNDETQVYGQHAEETKETLNTKILNHAEEGFNNVMKLFKDRISKNCGNEVQLECEKKQSLDKFEAGVNSLVEKYRAEFLDKTKGLKHYKNKHDHDSFLHNLETEANIKIADAKERHAKKALRITKGVLLGVAGAAAGIVSVATIGPVVAAVGATAAVVTAATAGTVAAVTTGAAVAIEAVESKNHDGSTGAAAQASRKLQEAEHKLDATEQGW